MLDSLVSLLSSKRTFFIYAQLLQLLLFFVNLYPFLFLLENDLSYDRSKRQDVFLINPHQQSPKLFEECLVGKHAIVSLDLPIHYFRY